MRLPGVQAFRKLNRNVQVCCRARNLRDGPRRFYLTTVLVVLQLGLSFTFFETASASIRSGEILSAYIYLITKSNSFVGYVQGVNGILQARAYYSPLQLHVLLHPALHIPGYMVHACDATVPCCEWMICCILTSL